MTGQMWGPLTVDGRPVVVPPVHDGEGDRRPEKDLGCYACIPSNLITTHGKGYHLPYPTARASRTVKSRLHDRLPKWEDLLLEHKVDPTDSSKQDPCGGIPRWHWGQEALVVAPVWDKACMRSATDSIIWPCPPTSTYMHLPSLMRNIFRNPPGGWMLPR